eukprot:Nk52_evm25s2462 gene=Nk52_evmTU25s2462
MSANNSTFVRKSYKYLIQEEHVPFLEEYIERFLPVCKPKAHKGDIEDPTQQTLSSIYFDTHPCGLKTGTGHEGFGDRVGDSSLALYKARIQKQEGAPLVRVRWYGNPVSLQGGGEGSGGKCNVFVEQKVHHESWVMDKSAKERFSLPLERVEGYFAGKHRVEKKSDAELAARVQDLAMGLGLVPVVRVQYKRRSFQHEYSARIRITIDTKVCMFPTEWDIGNTCLGKGKRNQMAPLPVPDGGDESDGVLFPFAIVEVKLQFVEGEELPHWVSALVAQPFLHRLKVSKYGYGVIRLYDLDGLSSKSSNVCTTGKRNKKSQKKERRVSSVTGYSHILPEWYPKMLNIQLQVGQYNSHHEQCCCTSTENLCKEQSGEMVKENQAKDKDEKTETTSKHTSPILVATEDCAVVDSFFMGDSLVDMNTQVIQGTNCERASKDVERKVELEKGDKDTSDTKQVAKNFKTVTRELTQRSFFQNGESKTSQRHSRMSSADFSSSDVEMIAGFANLQKPMKVEPKTFFANERTFLRWISMAVTLNLLSIVVAELTGKFGFILAMIYGPLSIGMMVYALVVFQMRSVALRKRKDIDFHDKKGSIGFAIVLISITIANLALVTTDTYG